MEYLQENKGFLTYNGDVPQVSTNRGQAHIASAFYLAKKAGVNIDEVRIKRLEEEQRSREEAGKSEQKLANLQTCRGTLYTRTRVHKNMGNQDKKTFTTN